MTPRRDLAKATYLADKAIDALYRPAAPRLAASVRRNASDGVITQAGRLAIMRDVDRILDSVGFPKRRGARCDLQTLIEQRANAARVLPIADAVAVMRRHVPDDVLTAMGDEG